MSDGGGEHGGGNGGGGGHGKRRGHDEDHEEHENHERWLVSYADMMTLLMVLFIVMFAISQVDQKKFMALKTGLSAGFGAPIAILSGADQLLDVGGAVAPDSVNLAGATGGKTNSLNAKDSKANSQADPVDIQKVADLANATEKASVAQEVKNLKEAQKALQKALLQAGLKDGATFRFDERGLIVSIATDKVLFDSGNATLLPEGRTILDALTPTLAALPNKLSVDGHTNSAPISTAQFPSNWELSTARATGVLRYLAHAIPVTRMSATGFADTHPLKPASDPSAMTVNRRIEIVVLAAVDNSAGRAVEQLGNQQTPDAGANAGTGEAAATGDATGTSGDPAGGTAGGAGGTPSSKPSATGSATSDAGSGSNDDPWAKPSPTPKGSSDWTADQPSPSPSPADWTG